MLFSKRLNFPNHTSEDTAGSIGYAWTYLCSLHICSWLIPPFLPVILTMDFPLIVPVRKVVPFYPIIYIYMYIYIYTLIYHYFTEMLMVINLILDAFLRSFRTFYHHCCYKNYSP